MSEQTYASYDDLVAEIARLRGENDLRKRIIDRLPLCPDHRDKQGQDCLACANEQLRAEVERLTQELSKATRAWNILEPKIERLEAALAKAEAVVRAAEMEHLRHDKARWFRDACGVCASITAYRERV